MIWRHRWAVLAATVAIAILVFIVSETRPSTYQAQEQLSVSIPQTQTGQPPDQTSVVFVADTYAQMGLTRPVISDAAKRSGLNISEQTASDRISVTASTNVGFVTVSATGPSGTDATKLASAESTALVQAVKTQQAQALQSQVAPVQAQINSVKQELAALPPGSAAATAAQTELQSLVQTLTQTQLQPTNLLTIVSPARAGSAPVSPKPATWTLLALLTALVVNSELAAAYEVISDHFSVDDLEEEVRRITSLPVLAQIPPLDPEGATEAFRTLRTNLLFMESDEHARTVAVVSPDADVGKTFTAMNLATSVAQLGVNAALVDADMRRPAVHERLGLHQAPGLSEVVKGAPLSEILQHSPTNADLAVLTAGTPPGDPAGQLGGQLIDKVFRELADQEMIVVDTPPVSMFSDALTIAFQCNATLIVLDAHKTRRRSVRQTVERLRQVNARPTGVVINRVASATPRGSAYRYYRERASALYRR